LISSQDQNPRRAKHAATVESAITVGLVVVLSVIGRAARVL